MIYFGLFVFGLFVFCRNVFLPECTMAAILCGEIEKPAVCSNRCIKSSHFVMPSSTHSRDDFLHPRCRLSPLSSLMSDDDNDDDDDYYDCYCELRSVVIFVPTGSLLLLLFPPRGRRRSQGDPHPPPHHHPPIAIRPRLPPRPALLRRFLSRQIPGRCHWRIYRQSFLDRDELRRDRLHP